MSPRTQGYAFVLITMCIWGGFTLSTRLSAQWGLVLGIWIWITFSIGFSDSDASPDL